LTAFTYNGASQGVVAVPAITGVTAGTSSPGVYSGDSISMVYTGTRTATNAGSYSVTANAATSSPSSNYSLSVASKTKSWDINPLTATLSWSGASAGNWDGLSVTYDGAQHNVQVSVSNKCGTDSFVFVYSGDVDETQANTGLNSYNTEVTALGNANYTLIGSTGTDTDWYIAKRVVTVGWAGSTQYVYNGGNQGVTLTLGNIIAADSVEFEVETLITGSADNITCSITSGGSVLSDMNVPPTYTITNSVGSTSTIAVFRAKLYGTYEISSIAITSNDNYTLSGEDIDFEWVIGKRKINITWAHIGSNPHVYNTTEMGVSMYITGLYANGSRAGGYDEVIFATQVSGTLTTNDINSGVTILQNNNNYYFKGTSLGTYSITISETLSGQDSVNYEIDSSSTKTFGFTINKKSIDLISGWFLGTWVYGGSNSAYSAFTYDNTNKTVSAGFVAGATSDSDGLVYSADAASVEFDYSTGTDLNIQKNAGTYTSTATTKTSGVSNNYIVATNGTLTGWVINKATISVTWTGSGTDYVYNGQDQGIQANVSGIATSDSIKLTTSLTGPFTVEGFNSSSTLTTNGAYNFKAKNAYYSTGLLADYEVYISAVTDSNGNSSSGANCNYSISSTTGDFTIDRLPISLTWVH